MKKCHIVQYGDMTECKACGLVWDTNDPCEPDCEAEMMYSIIERVINWNRERYDQEYTHTLQTALLKDTVSKFTYADSRVERVKELSDIIYLAIGALWKLGLGESQIRNSIMAICNSNDTKTITKTLPSVKANIDKGVNYMPPESDIAKIINEG